MTNHYKVLGIAADATAEEVRRAWRRAAIELHPDRWHEPDAVERFKQAREAYDILSDAEARAHYDASLRRALVGVELRAAIDLPFTVAATGGRVTVNLDFGEHGPRHVVLQVPAGATPGQMWRFPGLGGRAVVAAPGALVVELRTVLPDPRWEIVGLDLHMRRRVSLAEVYEGADLILEGPRGPLSIRLPRGEFRQLRVPGYGQSWGDKVGDLVVTLEVVLPPLDGRLRAELRRFA